MRRAAGVATAAVLSLTGCAGGDPSDLSILEAQPRQAPRVLPGEAGGRWVGMDGVMVEVPRGWRTETQTCGEADGPVVHFPGRDAAVVDCAQVPTSGVASLMMAPEGSGRLPGLPRGPRVTTRVKGVAASHSPMVCQLRPSSPQECSVGLVAPEPGVELRVNGRGPRAIRLLRAIRGSLTPVPRGYVAVPSVELGTSVERAKRQLEAAGLEAASPEVDLPHYATGTDPAAGTVVARGSTIGLTIGDG